MTGTVKFYRDEKGFGFILPDDGSKEIFFHISNCADGIEALSQGQRVRYAERTAERSGKPEAYDVALIG